ncbi:EpsG family protein [Vibrio furnissii]|uniref:EpsG family protein n=1 Tax=Vibrio furnissii TaxID=29494 RepID=UPI003D267192
MPLFLCLLLFVCRIGWYKVKPIYFYGLLIFFLYVLILVCFRGPIDRDYNNYLNIYSYLDKGVNYVIEPTFILSYFVIDHFSLKPEMIFVFYGIIGVSLKYFAALKFSNGNGTLLILAVLTYSSGYLFLHEMTQIRVGVACGFFLISILYYADNKKLHSLVLILVATLFHFSSILALVIFIFGNEKIKRNEKVVFYVVYISSVFIVSFDFSRYLLYFISNIPVSFVQEKALHYFSSISERNINLFNIHFIIYSFVAFISLNYSDTINAKSKCSPVLIRLFAFSLLSKLIFSSIPILSFRVSEFYSVVEIFVIPLLFYLFRPRSFSIFIPIIISLMLFVNYIFFQEIIKPYEYITYSSSL